MSSSDLVGQLSNQPPSYEQYDCPCIGSAYGCPEKTNGSQYCCKYYCPYEEDHKGTIEEKAPKKK